MDKPGILLITRNFPPLWGGMERLNWYMAQELSKSFKVHVIAPVGARGRAPEGISVREVSLRPLWRFLLDATRSSLKEARTLRPDIILAGSGLTAPSALFAARITGARCMAYVHGLDLAVPHPVYRSLWLPALRHTDHIIANSGATAELAEQMGIPIDRVSIVHPGVALPKANREARGRFRARHGLGEEPILLSVGRLTARKGLREFVGEVLPRIVAAHPNVQLVVVGDAPTQSLYAEVQTPETIQAAADDAGVGRNLRFLGAQFEDALTDAYFGADIHIFPVRHIPNDPEGFGMVAIEAAAHGLATVAYATGGVVDAVAEGVSGRLVKPGNPRAFAESVLALLAAPLPPDKIRGFADGFSWSSFGAKIAHQMDLLLT